MNERTYC